MRDRWSLITDRETPCGAALAMRLASIRTPSKARPIWVAAVGGRLLGRPLRRIATKKVEKSYPGLFGETGLPPFSRPW